MFLDDLADALTPSAPHAMPVAPLPAADLPAPEQRLVLIGLCGRAGSGKTAASDYLCQRYGFARRAVAGTLKSMLERLLSDASVDYAHLYEPRLKAAELPELFGLSARQLMQSLGDWGRQVHPDLWIRTTLDCLGILDVGGGAWVHDRLIIDDLRYPNEAAAVRQRGGTIIRLRREDADAAPAGHDSEAWIEQMPAHRELANHGPTLTGLHAHLDALMRDMGVAPAEPVEAEYLEG